MNTLASTFEMGAHPATSLLIGGLVAAILRGRFASVVLILAPLFGLLHVHGLEVGGISTMNLFGYEIVGASVDQQAKAFGYLFHIAALVAGIYSFHLRDTWQISMALFYAATAVGVAFAGDMLSLFGPPAEHKSTCFAITSAHSRHSSAGATLGSFRFVLCDALDACLATGAGGL